MQILFDDSARKANQGRRWDVTLLFRIDKSSLGVSRIGVATLWDDCPYAKSNANTFVHARA